MITIRWSFSSLWAPVTTSCQPNQKTILATWDQKMIWVSGRQTLPKSSNSSAVMMTTICLSDQWAEGCLFSIRASLEPFNRDPDRRCKHPRVSDSKDSNNLPCHQTQVWCMATNLTKLCSSLRRWATNLEMLPSEWSNERSRASTMWLSVSVILVNSSNSLFKIRLRKQWMLKRMKCKGRCRLPCKMLVKNKSHQLALVLWRMMTLQEPCNNRWTMSPTSKIYKIRWTNQSAANRNQVLPYKTVEW